MQLLSNFQKFINKYFRSNQVLQIASWLKCFGNSIYSENFQKCFGNRYNLPISGYMHFLEFF